MPEFNNKELIMVKKIFNIFDSSIQHIDFIMSSRIISQINDNRDDNDPIGERILSEFLEIPTDSFVQIDMQYKKELEIKEECKQCFTYTQQPGHSRYRCAVKGHCPGLEKHGVNA